MAQIESSQILRNHLRNSQNLRNFGHDKDQVQVFSPNKSLSRFSWKNDQAIKSLFRLRHFK